MNTTNKLRLNEHGFIFKHLSKKVPINLKQKTMREGTWSLPHKLESWQIFFTNRSHKFICVF